MEETKKTQCRTWLATHNNPEEPDTIGEWLEKMYTHSKARYICGQLEKGAEGTVHIQYYINFKAPKRLTVMKKLDPVAHWEAVHRDNGAGEYCMKEDTRIAGPWEYGTKPVRVNSAHDWEEVRTNAKNGQLDKIDPEIYIKHYRNL